MIGGGQSLTDWFRVRKNTGGTDYEILSGLTGETVATARTDKAFSLIELADTKPQFQDDGTVQISFDNYQDDEGLYDFLDAVNPPASSSGASKPDVTLETGVKKLGSSGSTDSLVLGLTYGAYSTDGTKIKCLASLGNIKKTSGSYGQKADDWSKPTFEFVGTIAEFDLEIAAGIFHSGVGGLIDATDVATKIPKIAKGAGYARKFVAKHT